MSTGAVPDRFSARLRAETAPAHEVAERTGALDRLLRGAGGIALYRALLTQLSFVYRALDDVARDLRDDPVAAPFADPALDRLPLLEGDLVAVAGPAWRSTAWPLPATADYVARIREIGGGSSAAFVAHHYTRHLGDLSGGISVAAAVRENLGVTATDGAAFLSFVGVDTSAVKARYRARLDTAPWSETERDRVVAEVLVAYDLNTAQQRALTAPDSLAS